MTAETLIVGDDGANSLAGTAAADLIYGFDPEGPQATVAAIDATRIASGLRLPLFATAPPNDPHRLFIVEQTGLIKILDLRTNAISATPFLDLSTQISTAGEGGLLGLAFDPDYGDNGFFYVNLINPAGDTEIRRYHAPAPDAANPASAHAIITIDQPAGRTNHKAGWLGFGPDGHLYAALGDGGGAGDPDASAQNPDLLLGKMLRLDVGADGFPADPARNYAIPSDNPFVGVAGADEIYALGLRNPWRSSFDRGLGDFFIADVGQARWEEINFGVAGANYGWDKFEGPDVFEAGPTTIGTLTAPISFYGRAVGQSVTGGYVYRGEADGLQGQYFYADFSAAKIFTLAFDGASWIATDRTAQIAVDVGVIDNPSSFGEDALGNLYIVDYRGDIFRLTPQTAASDAGDTLNGGGGEDQIHGGAGADTLIGGEGDDLLLGGAGADYLTGGAGSDVAAGGGEDDLYIIDNVGDFAVETANNGFDQVFANVNYSLAPNQHIELISTFGSASSGDIDLTGNDFDNAVVGNRGDNVLEGAGGADRIFGHDGRDRLDGGAGNDLLSGGRGDDIYIIDSQGDQVIETFDGGLDDQIFANVDYVLAAGAHVESLNTFGASTTANINLTGNELANMIFGNRGANTLNGRGGADIMRGFEGDDIYVVDNAGDQVIEAPGGGVNDQIYVNFDYVLASGVHVEMLNTFGSASTANINLTGNENANVIYGNGGANTLNGRGGADIMRGFAGDDIYILENTGDQVLETSGGGVSDQIFVNFDYALAPGVHVEILNTFGSASTANINLTGNEIDNTILGNIGANILNGGLGRDRMFGFAGSDIFLFDAAPGSDNVDVIGDYVVADDSIHLESDAFAGLATGELAAEAFVIGAAASQDAHRIVYDDLSGALFYDADGSGAAAQIQFATMSSGLSMTNADFIIV